MPDRDFVVEALNQALNKVPVTEATLPAPPPRLKPIDLQELFALDIKPREMVLDPILPEKGLVMIYAARGTGKTHFANSIAYAVATGGKFLRWQAPKARRVLLIDGEMPGAALRDRLKPIMEAAEVRPEPGMFQVLAGDLVDGGIGNLASSKLQAALDPWLQGIELLILDNLSSLTAVIRDNDAESWTPIQEWLLRLRRRGISVLIVHHAGKGGEQRGTSRREDVLDTSISLRRPTDYVASEGARFEVHIEKGRGIHGDQAKPFEARLEVLDGKAIWTMKGIEDANMARVRALLDDGMSIREIADETGIRKSTVHNLRKKIEEGKSDVGHLSKTVSKPISAVQPNECAAGQASGPKEVDKSSNFNDLASGLKDRPAVQAPKGTGQLDSRPAESIAESGDDPLDIPPFLRRPFSKGERLGPPAISAGPGDDLADFIHARE
jgi:putative DNA primase/helicase